MTIQELLQSKGSKIMDRPVWSYTIWPMYPEELDSYNCEEIRLHVKVFFGGKERGGLRGMGHSLYSERHKERGQTMSVRLRTFRVHITSRQIRALLIEYQDVDAVRVVLAAVRAPVFPPRP